MRAKVTLLMELATNTSNVADEPRRIGGWSEGWYYDGPSISDLTNKMYGGGGIAFALCPTRAGLLPNGAQIVGQRVQQIDPVGPSQSLGRRFPGTYSALQDVPQMALLCTVPAVGTRNVRRLILRGIPDARVVEGEYQPSAVYRDALEQFFRSLQHFTFRGKNLAADQLGIIGIDNTGLVTLSALNVFLPNQMVQIRRTIRNPPATGAVGGVFQVVSAGPGPTQFLLRNWDQGPTTGGTVSLTGVVYPSIDWENIAVNRVITRRVGRAFFQYRGRRSKRRS